MDTPVAKRFQPLSDLMSRRIEGIVHFPSPLRCLAQMLGAELVVSLADINGILALPGSSSPTNDGPFQRWLSPPPGASSQLLAGRSNEMWGFDGINNDRARAAAKVHAAVMYFDLPDSFSDDEVKERGESIGEAYERWLTLFWQWLEALNEVSYLDPNHRTNKQEIQLRGLMQDGYRQANITSMDVTLIMGLPPASEETLGVAIRLASEDLEVPLEHRLLAEARSALRLGDHRQAILDASTATELALNNSVDRELATSGLTANAQTLLDSAYRMLGNRVKLAGALGIALPPRLRERLVEPRNRVMHRGLEVDQSGAVDAVAASAEVIRALSPLNDYI